MDNDGGCKRFILVDDEYKFFFDHHLSGDNNSFLPPFDDDNGESETRNLGFEFYCDSKRSKLGGGGGTEKKPINNRVSQKRKRETIGFEAEFFPVATTRESIERENRVAERRKRKMAEFEGARVSRNQGDNKARKVSESTKVNTLSDVPLVRATHRDNKARKVSESKGNTLRDVPLVRAQETIQRDSKARKVSESTKFDTLRYVPSVRAKETIQRDNKARKVSESKVNTLRDVPLVRATHRDNEARKVSESKVDTLSDVPLVRAKETIQRNNKAKKVSESKVDTWQDVPLFRTKEAIRGDNKARRMSESTKVNISMDVPLVRAKEVIQRENKAKKQLESKVDTLQDAPLFRTKEVIRRDNRIAERRKKKTDEPKAAGTSRVVTEPKAVNKTPRFVNVTQSNKGVSVGTRKKNVAVVDKDYMSYLTWLVDSLKDSTAVPGPTPETQKQSTMAPGKDHLAKGKVELDTESCSDDDDDIIMVSDSPFLSGESTPFVVSKSKTVIDLEKDSSEDEGISCLFMKELMEALEKPYDERELLRLSGEVSVKKPVSRCRELRKGRVSSYETSELGPSYLEKVSDFDKEYRRVDGDDDKTRLKLLRGFFFYLKNVTRAGSFKPWLPENQKKLRLRKQCLQP